MQGSVRVHDRWHLASLVAFAALASAAPPKLSIVQCVLHDQREDAPAISANYRYVAGEVMYLSYRIAGFTVKNEAVELRWQMYVTDPDGLLLAPMEHGDVKQEVTSNDKDWLPRVDQAIPLPPQLNAGDYAIHLRVSDETAQATAEESVPFRVRGRAKEKLEGVLIRALHFYRGEDDPTPIDPAVFHPGAQVWSRFEIAGYQSGEKNAFDVEYGLAVYRPSGELLFEQPVAANEHDAPFYPKLWLMGGFNLNLGADLSPGEYTVKVQVRDKLAGKSGEQTAVFQVKN